MKTTTKATARAGFDEAYKKLNNAQKQAVDTIEGPLLVVAGPGSGKTQILSLRVANILRQTQALPSNILCLTFTESAALNMRDRLSKLMGQEAYRVAIHTFHNFCVHIIQKYPEFFYGGALFAAADPLGQVAILEEIFDSLPHNNPLRSVHPDQGYVYLKAVASAIGSIKKAGLMPSEFKTILEQNSKELVEINTILAPVFDARLSKKSFDDISEAIKKLESIDKENSNRNLARVVAISLGLALSEAQESDETKPLSAWKEKMMKRDDNANRVYKDTLNEDKMFALADIYEKYSTSMHERGLYDFDDMILDTISAIEKHPRLRYELQEQYQYTLVDEFQDTNDAQMRLLRLIADAPVNEGRPNLMVVGDDDQAVYKFQGAELSNILDFKRAYVDVSMVTMTANYRSTQHILDIASHIIRKGENRLENLLPEMEKTLIASHPDLAKKGEGAIIHKRFKSSLHEYHFVSREIKRLLDQGKKPEEIAVIARKHEQLESLVPFMQGAGVPIRYEREQNVFLEPHIHQLIVLSRFVASIGSALQDEADELLPEILSYPFWNLSRETIWDISIKSSKGKMQYGIHTESGEEIGVWSKTTWLSVMINHSNPRVRAVGKFLLELGSKALHEPLEKMLDMMIGAHVVLAAESEDEDDAGDIDTFKTAEGEGYVSPFKEYYFSKERFDHARAEYLTFLSSLRVFVRALREYKGKHNRHDLLLLKDLTEFVDLHEKNNIPLNDKSPFGSSNSAVYLLSAHKAKGLEFETVFVLSCQDDIWAGRGHGNKLSFPLNLQINPAGDDEDDKLRLFYVALTRAKRYLYLTSYETRDDGAPSSLLRFLLPSEEKDVLSDIAVSEITTGDGEPEAHELLTASWLRYHTAPFLGEEKKLLESLLENYQLSVTHLNNFLNVKDKGPQTFLEQNLLRFPQSKTPSGSFGSAVHAALEQLSIHMRREGSTASLEQLLAWFGEYLRRERLSAIDFAFYEKRGQEALEVFYNAKKDTFTATDRTEFNFKDQGVVLGAGTAKDGEYAHLTGKIDRIVERGGGLLDVHDYKTGRAKDSWEGKDQNEKVKLHEYQRQLIFYKILVESSRDFKDKYKVANGTLEFVEPVNGKAIDLSAAITKEQADRVSKLAIAVYRKIMNLDFPDISKYSPDLDGIQAFEDDLLSDARL